MGNCYVMNVCHRITDGHSKVLFSPNIVLSKLAFIILIWINRSMNCANLPLLNSSYREYKSNSYYIVK